MGQDWFGFYILKDDGKAITGKNERECRGVNIFLGLWGGFVNLLFHRLTREM
jgi:hypothetical protein